jgi:hypothetical protein
MEDRIHNVIPVRIEDILHITILDLSDDYFGNQEYYVQAIVITGNDCKTLPPVCFNDYGLFSKVRDFFLEQGFFAMNFCRESSEEGSLFNSSFDYRQSPDNANWLEVSRKNMSPVVLHLRETQVWRILAGKEKYEKEQKR